MTETLFRRATTNRATGLPPITAEEEQRRRSRKELKMLLLQMPQSLYLRQEIITGILSRRFLQGKKPYKEQELQELKLLQFNNGKPDKAAQKIVLLGVINEVQIEITLL